MYNNLSPMKSILLVCFVACGLFANAQSAIDVVAKETCDCLSKMTPATMNSTEIDNKFQGCLTMSLLTHSKDLKKSKTFNPEDPSEAEINALVQDIFKTCPTTMAAMKERQEYLEKTEVKLPKGQLVQQSMASVCTCMEGKGGKAEDFSNCLKEEMGNNQPSITSAYGDDMMTAIFGFMFDVTFMAMDSCKGASKSLLEGRVPLYKATTGDCRELASTSGDYYYDAQYMGRTQVKITPSTYKELDDKGKVKSDNKLVWTGCTANLIELEDGGVLTKKGDTTKLFVKRASPDGLVCIMKLGKIQTIVEYRKAK